MFDCASNGRNVDGAYDRITYHSSKPQELSIESGQVALDQQDIIPQNPGLQSPISGPRLHIHLHNPKQQLNIMHEGDTSELIVIILRIIVEWKHYQPYYRGCRIRNALPSLDPFIGPTFINQHSKHFENRTQPLTTNLSTSHLM